MKRKHPIYARIDNMPEKATWQQSSPFSSVEAAFNWVNTEYPIEHSHTHWELLLIVRGRIKHTLNGISKVMAEGDACLIRPDDVHKLTYVQQGDDKDYQSITYVFTAAMFSKIIAPYSDIIDIKRSDANFAFCIDSDLLKQIIDKSFSAQLLGRKKYQNASVIIITTLLLVLFQKNITSEQLYPEWLNDFINYLNSPYRFGVPISKLATHTPYSYSRLTTLFKEYTGKSLLTYMNDLKLVYAKKLLRTTNKQIIEISNELYYDSVSSFNHNFKNKFGKTPTEYRKEHFKKSTD